MGNIFVDVLFYVPTRRVEIKTMLFTFLLAVFSILTNFL